MPHIKIGDRLIGDGQPVYIIAEIGINHNGDPYIARQLIEIAADAGVDAVKFQKRALHAIYPRSVLDDLTTAEKELQFVIPFLQEAELSDEAMADLANYAGEQGVQFLCTPWDNESVDLLESIGVPAYKVASPDLTNVFLLERLAQTGRPLIMSTGMSRWDEIVRSVEFLKEHDVAFALLHCQSTYPAPFKDVHLSFMDRLRQFGVPVGYSGHERGIAVSTCAAALGACIIERHITLDRTMRGPDHAASLEPQGVVRQVRDIRALEQARGSVERPLSRGELLNRHALAKSLVTARAIKAGQTITRTDIAAMGPGTGISPQRYDELIGRTIRRDTTEGEQFRESDLLDEPPEQIAASFPLRWGPVVRYRDARALAAWNPDVIEFHLTDQDLDADPGDLGEFSQELVIHAPEYYHGQLMDLCSADDKQRHASLDIMFRVCEKARELRHFFPNQDGPVKIVVHPGGMTYEGFLQDTTGLYANLEQSAEELYREKDVWILLENHPPFPWYFGGQWYSNIFTRAEEIARFCHDHAACITWDLSHAQLWCNHSGESLIEHIRTVKPYIRHLHIADSSGTDGEALQIGEGETDFVGTLVELADVSAAWVPEIWLGHHNEGEGFLIALQRIAQALEGKVS